MNNKANLFRVNNFDLIRIFAAFQVVLNHAVYYLQVDPGSLVGVVNRLMSCFPGVPIFFFVSGFLISKSYEGKAHLFGYFKNRFLRLYPALFVCMLLSVFAVYLSGHFDGKRIGGLELLRYVLSQVTLFQFYTPVFMSGFGTGSGVLNGSLWTIFVEIQFYFLIPFLYSFVISRGRGGRNLIVLCAVFVLFHLLCFYFQGVYSRNTVFKLYWFSFLPWFWMFLVGVIFQRNFVYLHRLLAGRFLFLLPFYLLISYFALGYLKSPFGNGVNPFLFLALASLVFSFAYSFSWLAGLTLRGNDFSYGLYIYHQPVINLFVYFGFVSSVIYACVAIVAAILLAVASWFLIEARCLRFKVVF